MKNRRAILTLFLASSAASLLVVGVVACSSDDKPNTFNENQKDSGLGDTGPGFVVEEASKTGDGATPPPECKPSLPTTFKPVWTKPVVAEACTTDDIKGYYDACLPALKEQKCTDWRKAHDTCASCLEKPDNSGPIQTYRDRLYYTQNTAGCVALLQKKDGDDSCGAAYDGAAQCRRQSCDHCFDIKNSDFQNFISCQSKANDTGCVMYDKKSDDACVGYKLADGGAPGCFKMGVNEAEKDQLTRMAGFFCGKK